MGHGILRGQRWKRVDRDVKFNSNSLSGRNRWRCCTVRINPSYNTVIRAGPWNYPNVTYPCRQLRSRAPSATLETIASFMCRVNKRPLSTRGQIRGLRIDGRPKITFENALIARESCKQIPIVSWMAYRWRINIVEGNCNFVFEAIVGEFT